MIASLLLAVLFLLPPTALTDPLCGGARIRDSETPYASCAALLDDLLIHNPPFPVGLPLQLDLPMTAPDADVNPVKTSVHLPLTWSHDRCSITLDWVTGQRPPGRRIIFTMLHFSHWADYIAKLCIRRFERTEGTGNVVGENGMTDELRITVRINTGVNDPEYRRNLAQPNPGVYPQLEWDYIRRYRAEATRNYRDNTRLYD